MTCPQGIFSALYPWQSWMFAAALKYEPNFVFLLEPNTFCQCNALKISTCPGCANTLTQIPAHR